MSTVHFFVDPAAQIRGTDWPAIYWHNVDTKLLHNSAIRNSTQESSEQNQLYNILNITIFHIFYADTLSLNVCSIPRTRHWCQSWYWSCSIHVTLIKFMCPFVCLALGSKHTTHAALPAVRIAAPAIPSPELLFLWKISLHERNC